MLADSSKEKGPPNPSGFLGDENSLAVLNGNEQDPKKILGIEYDMISTSGLPMGSLEGVVAAPGGASTNDQTYSPGPTPTPSGTSELQRNTQQQLLASQAEARSR